MEVNPPNPFKGLQPYLKDDEARLFGRDRDLILIKTRVLSARTTLVFAGSGVGKTSFLNAKVIPQLEKQHCVILHNRWTGVDEMVSEEVEEPERIFWPPTEAISNFWQQLFKKPEPVKAKPEPVVAPKESTPEDRVADRVRKTIAQCLSAESSRPQALLEALAVFKKTAKPSTEEDDDDEGAESSAAASTAQETPPPILSEEPYEKIEKDRCILVLDQFEEVFQYHSDEEYFAEFIKDLCSIINDESYQVRVVISMREEFLGELSVFDNRIPDIFGNYYRLKHPTRDEAKDIIKRTCELSAVQPNKENLSLLVRDLSTFEKSSATLGTAASEQPARSKVISRNFIAPPYLQIACERLWNEQYANPDTALANGPAEPGEAVKDEDSRPAQFLANYDSIGGQNQNGSGGAALRVLRSFCEEKLAAPYLTGSEQNLTARAVGFLVTKQGAKMAYELSSLADHMDARIAPLRRTLRKLSQPEARILRESRGLDRSYWFELYHDMYAGIVDDWKRGFLKHKKAMDRRKLAVGLLIPAGFVLAILFAIFWGWYPYGYWQKLRTYRENLAQSSEAQKPIDSNVWLDYQNLKETIGYGWFADRLFAEILEVRAKQFAQAGDRERSFLSLLKAAAIRYPGPNQKDDLAKADFLMGDSARALALTYGDESTGLVMSPDRKYFLTISNAKAVTLYETQKPVPLLSFCSDCLQAIFTNDGKGLVTLSRESVSENSSRADQNKTRSNESTAEDESGNESQISGKNRPAIADNQSNRDSSRLPAMADGNNSKPGILNADNNAGNPPRGQIGIRIYTIDESAADGKPKITLKDAMAVSTPTTINKPPNAKSPEPPKSNTIEDEIPVPNLSAALSFESGGRWHYELLGTFGQSLLGWRLEAGTRVADPFTILNGDGVEDSSVVTSTDARFLIVDSSQQSTLFRVSDKGVIPDPQIKDFVTGEFALSADGRWLLGRHSDKVIRLWDLAAGKATEVRAEASAATFAFSRNGEQFVIGTTMPPGEEVETFATKTQARLHKIVLNGISARIELGSNAKVLGRLRLETSWDPEHPWQTYERWNLENDQLVGRLEFSNELAPKHFTAELSSVLAVHNGRATEWRIEMAEAAKQILPTGDKLGFIQLSNGGNTLLTRFLTNEGSVGERLWNVKTMKPICDLQSEDDQNPGQAVVSFDGRYAVKSTNEAFRLWAIEEKCSHTDSNYRFESGMSHSVSRDYLVLTRDNKMFAVWTDAHEIVLTPFDSRSMPVTIKAGPALNGFQFSPDGKYLLASYGDPPSNTPDFKRYRLWTSVDGREINLAGAFDAETEMPVLNSASQMITWGGDSGALLWDLNSRLAIRTLSHDAKVSRAAFSQDGRSAVTVDENGVVKLWDVQTGATTGTVKIAAPPTAIELSSDGEHLLLTRHGWMDHILIKSGKLIYHEAIVPGAYEKSSLFITGKQIGMVRTLESGSLAIIALDLDHESRSKMFSSNPQAMLDQWQVRLGLSVEDRGDITRSSK